MHQSPLIQGQITAHPATRIDYSLQFLRLYRVFQRGADPVQNRPQMTARIRLLVRQIGMSSASLRKAHRANPQYDCKSLKGHGSRIKVSLIESLAAASHPFAMVAKLHTDSSFRPYPVFEFIFRV